MEERQHIVIAQRHRYAYPRDGLAVRLFLAVGFQLLELVFVHILRFVGKLYARALFAAVARNEAVAVAETDYSEVAVGCTAAALRRHRVVRKIAKLVEGKYRRSALRLGFGLFHSEDCAAESAHQSCYRGADNVSAKLHLKRAQYGVV